MCLGAVTSALCCAGSCFCNCCCKALSACGVPAKNFPKVAYVISDLILMIISVLLMYTIRPLFKENSNRPTNVKLNWAVYSSLQTQHIVLERAIKGRKWADKPT